MISKRVLYYGRDEALPERLPLRAGPLAMVFENGDLRYIRLGEREVLRRIYVAVRDRNWGTIPATLSNLSVRKQEDSFEISYDVDNRHGDIHFRWNGRISGTPDGTLMWTMDGKALSTFWRNRIGFCVLHPVRECAGQPCTIETPEGRIEKGAFPKRIAPHQPFFNIRAMSHEVQPGVTAEVRFGGDIFETEDQRNWSDASYKTYSTPLALPFPVEVKAGAAISQSVRLSLKGAERTPVAAGSGPLELRVGERSVPLHEIGLSIASHDVPLDARQVERLKALRLSHLRADISLAGKKQEGLARAVRETAALSVPLEMALFATDAAEEEFAALAAALRKEQVPIRRWLIFHSAQKSTDPKWVAVARRHLAPLRPGVPFFSGTNMYFTELNRQRPDPTGIDGGCYSLNPQVHAFDNATMAENLAAQAETVESARGFLDGKPVSVTPVTLKPRFNPDATAAERGPAKGDLPPQVDPRQMSLFGAGWTLGSLKNLAQSGAASVTYYETTGWRGVMELAEGCSAPERFRSLPGGAFPLYHVLADAGEFAGGEVVVSQSSDPLAAEGLVLRKNGRTRILIASYSETPQRIRIAPVPSARWRRKRLDEMNAEEAMRSPERFRADAGETIEAAGGSLELELGPFALVRLDSIA